MPSSNESKAALHPAIVVDNLTKQFRVRHHPYSLKQGLLIELRRRWKGDEIRRETVLDSISFTIPHGETVAVIGRNGSGKSTLLSILSRVYEPTSGTVALYGRDGGPARIAPLLALGAGFHPDLDGYENIAFYGAILGMSKQELAAKRESIVKFSELEAKMDTTMLNWSDGMRLRLGFSLAIHTDPDILLVDEVLAVGDEAFQNKCYRRIAELQAEGKTILFVSHDLPVVRRVAGRVIWLNQGVIVRDGPTQEVLDAYQEDARVLPEE
jgi:ABC-type polysaccharide/polyol phosphate transport system ATPase subunit